MKEVSKMKTIERTRVKRTLIALLLMFVLSFSMAFAGTDDPAEGTDPAGDGTQNQTEVQDPSDGDQTQTETPAEPAPAPRVAKIIKKGKYYYYQQANGKIRKKAGFVKVGKKKYYVRKGGKIRTSKTFRVKKKYYRAGKNGVIKTGVYKWNKKYCYSDENGVWKKKAGFVRWNGNRYYVQKGGTLLRDDAFIVKNLPYISDASGHVRKIPIPYENVNPVVAIARDEVGTMTGKKYWTWYFKTRFRDSDHTPWCGAFVAWVYNKAGLYDRVSGVGKFGNLGYVPSYSRFADKKGKWIKKADAEGGDIIIFGSNIHVGLVEFVYGDYIITIEGNSGPTALIRGMPGACVRKIRRLSNRGIKGVIRVL